VQFLVDRIVDGAPLVALRGLAGTGKTTLIPALRAALAAHHVQVVVGSPTHRAAMILRKKQILDADTVHAHALVPHFKPDYVRCLHWLGETQAPMDEEDGAPHEDIDGLPYLIHEQIGPNSAKAHDLQRQKRYKAARRLASIGIHGKDYFARFGPKQGEGVLIIDEASMVGQKMLTICQQAFQQIILIGDPGQLPPVKDTAMLATVEGVDLTEIHRQASDSPIIQLAYRARKGEPFWVDQMRHLSDEGDVAPCHAAEASAFLESPLIVWRNTTRIEATHAIRQALGYERIKLYPGEPLVCRSTSQEDRAEGFFNNGLFRIAEVDPDDSRLITVEDPLGNTAVCYAHLEEVDGDGIAPRSIPFRFGYCLTAHTAQGGEWPTVYISMPDLLKYAGMARRYGKAEEIAQWTYTAITRAKETLCFLTMHRFLAERDSMPAKLTPPSAPILNTMKPDPLAADHGPATPLTLEPDPVNADLDDIADPPTPAPVQAAIQPPRSPAEAPAPPPQGWSEHEALLQGFLGAVQKPLREALLREIKNFGDTADVTFQALRKWVDTAGQAGDHALYQLSNTIEKLQHDGLQLRHDPYMVEVCATSPEGFPVRFTIAKETPGAMLDELPEVLGWLGEHGYKASA
jgi:exodeoxyribonuclease-5